ncbi:hypothetical protein N9A49_05005 [Salibacteraceae bacterium]|nr:hypothetical protein [Salibacteraceae bacterium]
MRFTTIKYSCRLLIGIFAIVLSTFYMGCNGSSDTNLSVDYLLEQGVETLESDIDYSGVNKLIGFELYQLEFTMPLVFETELITHFDRAEHYEYGIELSSGESVEQKLYNKFLSEDSDLYLLEAILESLRNRTTGTEIDMVQLVVAFVQSIPYEIAEAQKYPFETLYLNKGDCSDKSVLLCKLLTLEGYDACLFSYAKAEHMSVGIRVDGEFQYVDGYAYIEATVYNPIGDIPKKLAGGVKIDEEPIIIYPNSNGSDSYEEFPETISLYNQLTEIYGDGYFSTTNDGRVLMVEMHRMSTEIDSLRELQEGQKLQIDSLEFELTEMGCPVSVENDIYETCKELSGLRNDKVALFNYLNDELNSRVSGYNDKTEKLNHINNIEDRTQELVINFDFKLGGQNFNKSACCKIQNTLI